MRGLHAVQPDRVRRAQGKGKAMALDRRWFIRSTGVSCALPLIAYAQSQSDAPSSPDYTDLINEVLGMLRPMPGVKSLLIWAPETADEPELKISLDPALRMFVGNAFKAFVLSERLRQLDPGSRSPGTRGGG